MEQKGPGSAFRLPTLTDAVILAFFDALRLNLNSGVAVTVTILGRTLAFTGGVKQLSARHPEFDWTQTSLIETMDLPLECGISVRFSRGRDGIDEIRTYPDDAEVPEIVLHYLRKEIQKMTGKAPRVATPSPSVPEVTATVADIRSDRMARLKRLHMVVIAEPEHGIVPMPEPVHTRIPVPIPAPIPAMAARRSAAPVRQPGFGAALMARLGFAKPRDKTTRRMQDNISFTLDTSAAKASDHWFKALVSAEMVMVVIFTIGILTIIVS